MRVVLSVAVALCVLFGTIGVASAASDPVIRVLSSRADLVTGGDALVEVVPPAGFAAAGLTVAIDGRDVTSAFAVRPDGRYLGLVSGLRNGANDVVARAGARGSRLVLTGHPAGGPLISGPQIQPWTCMAGALDQQCNRPPVYEYQYKSSQTGQFAAYDPENPPTDVATTTTDNGVTVPYIVRVETGSIDRDEYRIAVLWQPGQPWAPWAPQPQFNHKLLITHGASCDTAYTAAAAPDVLNDTALSRGFAVMSNALDNSGHNCNVVVQGEALTMTKERVIEQLGELRYTIGSGCSGGALAQQQTANAFPGIYQGITPACSFPDTWTGRMHYEDYSLLRRYFENPARWAGVTWTPAEISAVLGHPNYANTVVYNTAIAALLDPSRSCPGLDAEKVYDPATNPNGVRCSLQDYMVAIFGRRGKDNFANRPWDNGGVQYGLKALQAGKLTAAQFVDVNEKIGGRDIDYEPIPERAQADEVALGRAYRSGAVDQGTNLDQVAIIDLRGPDPGAFHDVYRTYVVRSRLLREHGTAANQVLWRGQVPLMGDATFSAESIVAMDAWLTKVEADKRDVPLARKILEDRPDSVHDRCTNGNGTDLPEEECDAVVQSYTTPRIEAGEPFVDDVLECERKPLRRSDYYPVQFGAAQWARLEKIFSDGVCDWSKPGVGREPTIPWQTYADGPGGVPLGPAPVSVALSTPAPRTALARGQRCVRNRRLTLRLRSQRGDELVSVQIYVNGRRMRTLSGHALRRPVRLRRLPRGTLRVKVVSRSRSGRRLVENRRYRRCR